MHTPHLWRYEPFAALADVRLNDADRSKRTLDSADDTHRAPLESLLLTCSVGSALALDSMSRASDVGRTLPLHSLSILLAISCSMPLETLLLPSCVGHMLPLETLLRTCRIEEASAVETPLATRRSACLDRFHHPLNVLNYAMHISTRPPRDTGSVTNQCMSSNN